MRNQYFRPQTVFVSQLFIQIIAYILGVVLEEIIPGPGNIRPKLQTKNTAFWRFCNPGPFSASQPLFRELVLQRSDSLPYHRY